MTKAERFRVFLDRLAALPPAETGEGAKAQLDATLNAVEDEFSGILFDPARWMTDGRMYPPQPDSARTVPGRPDLVRYRSKAHNTILQSNGAIEIRDARTDTVVFAKPGSDGQGVQKP